MAGIRVEGSVSGNVAEVDSNNNLKANLPGNTSAGAAQGGGNVAAGAVALLSENDPGTLTGARSVSAPQTSQDRRFRVGVDTLLFNDTFNATTQNTSLWEYILVTLTVTQPGAGTANFGTVQGTAATHGALMRSYQYFPIIGSAPIAMEFTMGQFTAQMVANEEWYCGFGRPTVGGTAVTDGVYLKLTTAGLFLEAKYNGSANTSGALATLASFSTGTAYRMKLVIGEMSATLWRNGILLGTLTIPAADGQPVIMASLPAFMQKLCTGAVSNTNTMRVGDLYVYLSDLATNKTWEAQLATLGQNGNLGQNGHTQGKTSLYANSTAPTAVALTNTTAAFTGLGGQAAVLPTLAVSSDGILMAYQNPVPTINITGRNLLIYGVTIESHVSVILSAAAIIVYQASMQYGHTAVSLATVETGSFITATTHAPRVVPLGTIGYSTAVAAIATTRGSAINVQWPVPYIVRPGEFVAIVLKLGVGGVVTATGAITFMVNYNAVWE